MCVERADLCAALGGSFPDRPCLPAVLPKNRHGDNLEQTLARLQRKGVEVLTPPYTIGGGKVAFIRAPDDVRIELMERPSR